MLGYVRYDRPFILETDASEKGVGAVLSQKQSDGGTRVIAYASRGFRDGECNKANNSSKKLELLALEWAVADKFPDYLIGTHFTVLTDNSHLAHLMKTKRLSALEQWWANALAVFDFTIQYRFMSATKGTILDMVSMDVNMGHWPSETIFISAHLHLYLFRPNMSARSLESLEF